MTMMTGPTPNRRDLLGSAEMRDLVLRIVRKRVPEAEVEDLVQTVLCDAVAARNMPEKQNDVRRWLVGIARHKVADMYRQRSRAQHVALPEQLEGKPPPHEAREWASWADKQTEGDNEAKRTLGWMAREGGGEKLAHIAEDEQLPPAQVRQRVSRLRRLMRRRWVAELAAVAGVGAMALLTWYLLRKPPEMALPLPVPTPEIVPSVELDPRVAAGRALRKEALKICNPAGDHKSCHQCLTLLDEAAELDPDGDGSKAVQAARTQARKALSLPEPIAPDADDKDKDNKDDAAPAPSQRLTPTSTPTAPPPTAPPPPVKSMKLDGMKPGPKARRPPVTTPPRTGPTKSPQLQQVTPSGTASEGGEPTPGEVMFQGASKGDNK